MSALVAKELQEQNKLLEKLIGNYILDKIHPVGSMYVSRNSTSPATLFGGTWQRVKDVFLLAAGDKYSAGSTGGSANSVLINHSHEILSNGQLTGYQVYLKSSADGTKRGYLAGGSNSTWVEGTAENSWKVYAGTPTPNDENTSVQYSGEGRNMPPYLTVYVWERIA